ncbi:MAG TPA: ABC transporter permease [Thermomicrobiales bacterium]|jgi:simple sugar transport system permease protein|nr:ABC transporter permease [Thermomicrobiales bacterium]
MAQTTVSERQAETPADSRRWYEAILDFVARYREASIAAVAVLLVIYIQLNNSVFLTSPLMSVVLRDTARIGLLAAGIVVVMITGEIDLSVGATYALAPYLMIRIATDWDVSLWLTAPLALLIGVGIGFANGFITVKLRIPSLITTLGTFFLLTGITVSYAHSQPIRMLVQPPFNVVFGQNRFGPLDPLFSWDGLTGFTPIIWALAVVLILTLVLSRTVFGLHVVSTGSNLLAAREIGVRTDRIKIAAFMIGGGLAALTGLITATVTGSAAPDTGGSTLTLLAIAAAVIGGTALTGGSGTVIGALIGAFVIACLNNGLVLLGAQATESNIYLGLAILAAMILNVQLDAVRVRRKR